MGLSTSPYENNFRWIVLGLATWAQATATFVTYGVGPLAAIWQQIYSLSQTQVGLLISVVNIGPLLSMLMIGHALDRYGERWIVGIGSLLLGLTMGFTSLTSSYGAFLFVLFFVGIHYGTAQPGGSKIVVKWFDSTQRGLAMGIRQAGIPIGGAMAGWIIPFLSTRYDWSIAVVCQATISILGGLLFLSIYRDPATENKQSTNNCNLMVELKRLLKQKELYPLLFTGFMLISLQMILVAHLMIFLKNMMVHVTFVTAGQMLSICLLFGMVGRIMLAWLSDTVWKGDRVQPLLLTIWSVVLGLLVLVSLPQVTPIWVLFILCAWLGFFGIGWYSLFIIQVTEKSGHDSIGFTVSYALTLNQIAIIVAPFLFGLLVDLQRSYFWSWTLLAMLLSISGIWLWNDKRSNMSKSVSS